MCRHTPVLGCMATSRNETDPSSLAIATILGAVGENAIE